MSEVDFQIDLRALDRAKKTLQKYEGAELAERLNRGNLQAARILVPSVRDASPIGPTKRLRGSVKARAGKVTGGSKIRPALVGPTAPHRHLVIQPHDIVTPGGRFTGRRTSGNPFVDAAVRPRIDKVLAEVQRILFAP